MFKFILFLVGIIGIAGYTSFGQNLTHRAINVVNPASAEQKALTDVAKQLEMISDAVNSKEFAAASPAERAKQVNQLIGSASEALEKAQEKAEEGDITATISSLIKKVVSDSPGNMCPQPTHSF